MAKILVVEDSITNRKVIVSYLQGLGHQTVEAGDGIEGEAVALKEKPDCIVLDVVMPNRNGFELLRDLRKTPGFEKTPIIMLTSKDQDSDKFWGMKQGANDYLTKPFSEEDLGKAVGKYVK
ncbi:MAG: response regulator [Bacteroidetes bacterium]|nr:response regulator [Bacteroidota bacterium]